jgi:molybdenum ABC transporter molybdate-binding protein
MFGRLHPAWLAFGGSAALLAGLLAALYWTGNADEDAAAGPPLFVYAAEALRLPLEAVARDYEAETGQPVHLQFGASQTLLTNLQVTQQGDLFVPADDSYLRLAREKNLIAEMIPLARMQGVVVVRPGYPRPVKTWADVIAPGTTICIGQPDSTAIGKLLRAHLESVGLWKELLAREPKSMTNVNEVGNAVRLGSVDVGFVWDVTARMHPGLIVVRLPELEGVTARVQAGVTHFTAQPDAARRFLRFLRAPDKGARHLKAQGFSAVEEGDPLSRRPELVLYAGAMMRPAVEPTVIEFERREGVRVTRVYNGCGILVSQMRAGERPDVYFACDPRFMADVQDLFGAASDVSANQLVLAVPRGNPRGLRELKDLGKEGLRVGVGHEQQCALGALTRETFIRTGVYAAVAKNVEVQSPTGDFLVNQLRTGSLDAVVAYRSNVAPFAGELEGIPVTGIDCAEPHQPIAVRRDTAHPELSRKLVAALRSPASRARFEALGFGWEAVEATPDERPAR